MIRRRGSHVRLKRQVGEDVHVETIPDHQVLAKGTLGAILKHVSRKEKGTQLVSSFP